MRLRASVVIAILLAAAVACGAQPTGQQVIDAVARQMTSVRDYQVDMTMNVKGPKISLNEIKMTLYFKRPDKVHVEAKQGMGIIPTGNFLGDPMSEMTKNARASYLRSARRSGVDCHVIRLTPANGSSMPPTTVWIDKAKNAIVATDSDGGMAMATSWHYTRVGGKYYLPSQITSTMKPPTGDAIRMTVTFSNYKVNKGISDKIFAEKPQSQPRPLHRLRGNDPDD